MRDVDLVLVGEQPVEGKVLNHARSEGKELIGNKGWTVKDDLSLTEVKYTEKKVLNGLQEGREMPTRPRGVRERSIETR